MRSWRDRERAPRRWRATWALLLSLGASSCADDELPPECDRSPLTYATFGGPFLISWCRGCHGAQLEAPDRQGAPLGVDFEGRADAVRWARRIQARVLDATMPPAGGPSEQERLMLGQWLACGAP